MNEPARAARHREALRVRLEKVREKEVHRIHREHAPLLHVRRLDRDDRLREDRVEEPPRHVGERELRDLVHEVPRPCLHPGRDRGRQLPLHLRGVDEHETHVHGQLCQLGLRLGELRAHPDGDAQPFETESGTQESAVMRRPATRPSECVFRSRKEV